MGVPSVTGASDMDSNNYMDVRNSVQKMNQGTGRVDRVFRDGDAVFARYSGSSETGFTPQNLPGFGSDNNNLAQNANITWTHIASPLVNTASVVFSRLTMFRYSQDNGTNDIVKELGIQGVGFGGEGASGAYPSSMVQGYFALWRQLPLGLRPCTLGTLVLRRLETICLVASGPA